MAAIGKAVAEYADLFAFEKQRLIDVLRDHDAGDGKVSRRQRLSDRDGVRLEAEFLAAERGAEPTEAADHLVADHEHVMLGADRHDLLEVGVRRHDDATRPHHRLGDERRNRVRAFLDDQRVELGGKPRGEVFLALAVLGEAIVMRTAGVQKARQRQIEIAVVGGDAGQRSRGDGDAMIRLHAADDLLFLRPAKRVVEVPDELDLAVVRLRSGIAEEDLRDRHRRHVLELFRKLDRRIVALAGEQMREGKLAHLRGGGFDQFLVAVAERGAPQPRHALDVRLAVGVVDINAFAALEDDRSAVAEAREIGIGMHQSFDVAGGEIAERRHSGPL